MLLLLILIFILYLLYLFHHNYYIYLCAYYIYCYYYLFHCIYRYVNKNLSLEVRKLSAFLFHLLAHVSETTCFILLGLSVFLVDFPIKMWVFMLLVTIICLLSRPFTVYPLIGAVSIIVIYCMMYINVVYRIYFYFIDY